jgi:AraC-like DNA-binding protein
MSYIEYKPTCRVGDFIDSYWIIRAGIRSKKVDLPIYPDGGTEILINNGVLSSFLNGKFLLRPGRMYLLGTKVAAGTCCIEPDSELTGIRFKPGGFAAFYDSSVSALVDTVIDFPDPALMNMLKPGQGMFPRFDQYFAKKHRSAQTDILAMTQEVYKYGGRISVKELSGKHNISTRTLERIFKLSLGISPKEFINIVRFRQVLKRLQEPSPRESLLRIAFETGYYDHAHLTREFKKYAGFNPIDIVPTVPRVKIRAGMQLRECGNLLA